MAKRYEFFAVFACVLDAFIQKKMQKAKGEEPAKIGVDYEPKRHLPHKRYEKMPFLRGLVLKTGRWGALGVRAHDAATHQPVGTGVLDCPLFRIPLYNSLAAPARFQNAIAFCSPKRAIRCTFWLVRLRNVPPARLLRSE